MKRILCTLAVAILFATSALAKIIRVPADQPTIQAAINAAAKGDTVLVVDGIYYENINFKGKAITVASHFLMDADTSHISKTIIDGSKPAKPDSGSVVFFVSGEDTTSVLCGFTITKGSGTETTYLLDGVQYPCRAGGGIFCYNSGALIVNNRIINNATASSNKRAVGGGISALPFENTTYLVLRKNRIMYNAITANTDFAWGGGVAILCNGILSNNLIAYNSVVHNATTTQASGGGVWCWSLSSDRRTVILEFNKVTYNSVVSNSNQVPAALGSGVVIRGNQGRFTKNEVSQNEIWVKPDQYGTGAGMQILGVPQSFIIESNIIRENAVRQGNGYGGGINIADLASPTLVNNIIEGNSGTNGGGFLITGNSVVKLINNTIINNLATSGGGICLGLSNSTNYLMNSIIWGNQASTNPAIHIYTGTIAVTYSDVQGGWSGEGNINAGPVFADNAFRLADASPCIGKGMTSHNFGAVTLQAPATDFFGNSRPNPIGSRPDLGAVEHSRAFPKQPHLVEVPKDYPTIQAAIKAAAKGDTVLVAEGTYYENINFKGKAITVASHFLMDADTSHISKTIIDGSKPAKPDSGSVVFFVSGEDTTSVLCGFTITKGSGTETTDLQDGIQYPCRAGGGILCHNSGARILHNKIIGNTVYSLDKDVYGGGLVALPRGSTAWIILTGNQIAHNMVTANLGPTSPRGGGVLLYCNGVIVDNLISFNSVAQNASDGNGQASGGGLGCTSDTTARRTVIVEFNKITHNSVITKSNTKPGAMAAVGGVGFFGSYGRFASNEVSHNELWANSDISAIGAGLALNLTPASFVIAGNTIRQNAVKRGNGLGGGVLIGAYSSSPVVNNIVEGNSATVGGGLLISSSTVQLINNTVINNQATSGGGINVRLSASVYLMNTIVWGNQASTYAGVQLQEGTVQAAYCDIQGGWSGVGNKDVDPLLVADSLSIESNCIGAGTAVYDFGNSIVCQCPDKDINSRSRPYPAGTTPDIGAWESTRSVPYTVGVASQSGSEIPKAYVLHQNYPNPFNPSTAIEFALPKAGFVTLKIYDLLGNEVATLVAEKLPAGKHQRVWEAESLASGVYLYRLEAGDPSASSGRRFVQTRKLILLR